MKLNNYNVKAQHYRFPTPVLNGKMCKTVATTPVDKLFANHDIANPNPKGGATIVSLIDKQTGKVTTGYSFCSRNDAFVRRAGTALALQRALVLAEVEESATLDTRVHNNQAHDKINQHS